VKDEDQTLLKIEFTAKGGKLDVNKEAIGHALSCEDTRVTAIALLTLLDFFMDKGSFIKGMKKTAKNLDQTIDRLEKNIFLFAVGSETLH
jgi:hypothetical protein